MLQDKLAKHSSQIKGKLRNRFPLWRVRKSFGSYIWAEFQINVEQNLQFRNHLLDSRGGKFWRFEKVLTARDDASLFLVMGLSGSMC